MKERRFIVLVKKGYEKVRKKGSDFQIGKKRKRQNYSGGEKLKYYRRRLLNKKRSIIGKTNMLSDIL